MPAPPRLCFDTMASTRVPHETQKTIKMHCEIAGHKNLNQTNLNAGFFVFNAIFQSILGTLDIPIKLSKASTAQH